VQKEKRRGGAVGLAGKCCWAAWAGAAHTPARKKAGGLGVSRATGKRMKKKKKWAGEEMGRKRGKGRGEKEKEFSFQIPFKFIFQTSTL
jgi:hypothetical protein